MLIDSYVEIKEIKLVIMKYYHSGGKEGQKLKLRHVKFQDEKMKDRVYFSLMNKLDLMTRPPYAPLF